MLDKLLKRRKRVQDEKGISLIEVVIILVIFGIAVIPVSRLAIKNLNSGGRYAVMNRAVFHAKETMEQIIGDYAAVNAGRGYDWVIQNWAGQATPNPPAGMSGSVTVSAEDSLNGVKYVVVKTTVSGTDMPDVSLTTWLIENN